MVLDSALQNGPCFSDVGFGCWAAGAADWGQVDDRETITAMHHALDLGISLFDTADLYGKGHAEELIGAHLSSRRSEIFLATKGGLDWGQFGEGVPTSDRPQYGMGGRLIPGYTRNSHPEYLTAALHASLQRLRTDFVDLYFVHWPDPGIPIADTAGRMLELREAGQVRFLGVSNFSVTQLREWLSVAPLDCVQYPYNLLWRDIEADVLPFCVEHGIPLMAYGTMAHGLLTGKFTADLRLAEGDFRASHPLFVGERYLRNLSLVSALQPLAKAQQLTVGQLSIAWVLSQPAVASALVGAKRREQVDENSKALGRRLTPGQLAQISAACTFADSK